MYFTSFNQSVSGILVAVLLWSSGVSAVAADLAEGNHSQRKGAKSRLAKESETSDLRTRLIRGIDEVVASKKYTGSDGTQKFMDDLRGNMETAAKEISMLTDLELEKKFKEIQQEMKAAGNIATESKIKKIEKQSFLTLREKVSAVFREMEQVEISKISEGIHEAGSVNKFFLKFKQKLESSTAKSTSKDKAEAWHEMVGAFLGLSMLLLVASNPILGATVITMFVIVFVATQGFPRG